MKQAMTGYVLEKEDFSMLRSVEFGLKVDECCITYRNLKALGAFWKLPVLKKSFPFIELKPKLTEKGEAMLYECRNHLSDDERWFIGVDILG